MRFTLVAVAAGILIGLTTGGRLRHLSDRSFRLVPLLVVGVALQVGGERLDSAIGLGLLLLSYLLLLGFAAVNASLVAMWLVALGIALNLVVIAANGGMPVRPSALVAAEIAQPDEVYNVGVGGKRHLERRSDRLTFLADIVPVAALTEVLSFGDIVLNVGVANVIVHLMRPTRNRHRRGSHVHARLGPLLGGENGSGGNGHRPLVPPGWPRRSVHRGREVGVGPRTARVLGAHRRR